jgi:general stress protein 26
MPTQTLDPTSQELLRGRYIAALGTENADGTIHLTAVWYLEDGHLFIATSSKSRKARNIVVRGKGLTDGERAKTGSRARLQRGRES